MTSDEIRGDGGPVLELEPKVVEGLRTDRRTVRRFLRFLAHPEFGCHEIRIMGAEIDRNDLIVATTFKSVVSGYFDSPLELEKCAARLRGVSCFISVNPCIPDLMARAPNLVVGRVKYATGDSDITALRFLFIDIDP